jgi:hypothetical protein
VAFLSLLAFLADFWPRRPAFSPSSAGIFFLRVSKAGVEKKPQSLIKFEAGNVAIKFVASDLLFGLALLSRYPQCRKNSICPSVACLGLEDPTC